MAKERTGKAPDFVAAREPFRPLQRSEAAPQPVSGLCFALRISDCGFRISRFPGLVLFALCWLLAFPAPAATPEPLFAQGTNAFRSGDYAAAAQAFRQAAAQQPAAGTLQNLGLAEWQRGRVGPSILAWEQCRWLDPFNAAVSDNLRYARKTAQVDSPQLAWYEVISTWLPVNWWPWITGLSLWLAVAMGLLPGILRWRKAVWHQAFAALGLAAFLLCLPAQVGVATRSRLGFVLQKNTPLLLTPTQEAQATTRLDAGEPARVERQRGRFLLIRTSRSSGWIERDQFGSITEVR